MVLFFKVYVGLGLYQAGPGPFLGCTGWLGKRLLKKLPSSCTRDPWARVIYKLLVAAVEEKLETCALERVRVCIRVVVRLYSIGADLVIIECYLV